MVVVVVDGQGRSAGSKAADSAKFVFSHGWQHGHRTFGRLCGSARCVVFLCWTTARCDAIVPGLIQSVVDPNRSTRDEVQKLQILVAYVRFRQTRYFNDVNAVIAQIQRNTVESEQQQDIVWSRFCALYLPDTVSRYLDLPALEDETTDPEFVMHYKLYNAYLEMLVQVQHTAYFAKYLRSNKPLAAPGKRLPSVLAQRLLELAPYLDNRMRTGISNRPADFYRSFTGSCIQLLSTLLTIFVKVPDLDAVVPTATRQGLLVWLRRWSERYSSGDSFLGDVSSRTLAQLFPVVDMKILAKSVRKQLKNMDTCALPSCAVNKDCKTCSK